MGKQITITVDGEDLVLVGSHHRVGHVLRVAGLNPDRYDLERVLPDGSSATVRRDIFLSDGQVFVTASISAGNG